MLTQIYFVFFLLEGNHKIGHSNIFVCKKTVVSQQNKMRNKIIIKNTLIAKSHLYKIPILELFKVIITQIWSIWCDLRLTSSSCFIILIVHASNSDDDYSFCMCFPYGTVDYNIIWFAFILNWLVDIKLSDIRQALEFWADKICRIEFFFRYN